jgi:hypothetical protein
MGIRITCINKDNGDHYDPHEGITNLGWINTLNDKYGKSTRSEMVKFVDGGGHAYVEDANSNKAFLTVRISSHGNKYVQTISDGKLSNNLLELLECK